MEITKSDFENANTKKIKRALGKDYWIRVARRKESFNVSNLGTSYKPNAFYFSKGTWILNDDFGGFNKNTKYIIIAKILNNDEIFDLTPENKKSIMDKYTDMVFKIEDSIQTTIKWNKLLKGYKALRLRDARHIKPIIKPVDFTYHFDVESLVVFDDSCIKYTIYEINDKDMNKIVKDDELLLNYLLELIKNHKKNN